MHITALFPSPCRTALLLLALHAASTLAAHAQQTPTGDSLDYFPYRAGDTWRIRDADTHEEFRTCTVYRDSIDGAGNIYLLNLNIRIEAAGDVYVDASDLYPELRYRLQAQVGDRWKLIDDTTATGYATCAAIYPESVFGETRMVKEFHYWIDLSGEGRTDSMWYATRWIAWGLGEIRQFYDPDALHYVSGARIGGRTYGDMMAGVAGSSSGSSLRIAPNPFTDRTTITYHLNTREHVRLTLSDALGRVVAVPVDEVQDAGERSVPISGTALPDGTYFYRLHTPSRTLAGTLLHRP